MDKTILGRRNSGTLLDDRIDGDEHCYGQRLVIGPLNSKSSGLVTASLARVRPWNIT